ncbi:putative protein OS=Afipia felis OX=1035 GN=BN961_01896 PE=4 SV=1 [Afipia felis]
MPVVRPAAVKCVAGAKTAPVTKPTATKKVSAKTKVTEPVRTKPERHIVNRKRSAVDRLNDPPPAPLPALLKRVSGAIERELTQIEIIICGSHVPPRHRTEAERRARTLASLARTLREVMLLRDREEKNCEDDDAVPRDLEELRRKLAQRLDELVAGAKAAHPGEAE